MTRLHTTAAALLVFALATSGCARNRNLPTGYAPSRLTTIGVNSYLWRAAVDTVSFAPLLQANASNGVIITDWYANPRAPGERVKLRLRPWPDVSAQYEKFNRTELDDAALQLEEPVWGEDVEALNR